MVALQNFIMKEQCKLFGYLLPHGKGRILIIQLNKHTDWQRLSNVSVGSFSHCSLPELETAKD